MTKVEFSHDGYTSICELHHNGKTYIGQAYCHPADNDYGSERTGCCIAEARAYIARLKDERDQLKPQVKILKHLYHNLSSSKYFNPKSYETKCIRSQLHAIEKQLAAINNDIAEEKQSLKNYIDQKEKLYQRLRAAKNQ